MDESPVRFQREEQQTAVWADKDNITTTEPPPIKVSELFAVCQEMVRPGGTDDELGGGIDDIHFLAN